MLTDFGVSHQDSNERRVLHNVYNVYMELLAEYNVFGRSRMRVYSLPDGLDRSHSGFSVRMETQRVLSTRVHIANLQIII